MGDQQYAFVGRAHDRVDPRPDRFERVDVEPAVGLVEDCEAWAHDPHLDHLGALLLAAREANIDRALEHVGIHAEQRGLGLGEADEFGARQLGFTTRAPLRVQAFAQELEVGHAGDLDRILETEEDPSGSALVRFEGEEIERTHFPFLPSEVEGRVSTTLDTNGEGGTDLFSLEPHERAAAGLFLGFQYPVEIPGVSYLQFLRESLNSQRRARGEKELSGAEFIRLAKAQAATLGMDAEMLKRPVNVGFSGGEKKRAEMVQMGIMAPRLAILDETDSGLDIDALKAVGAGINSIMRAPDKAVLLITHYQRLLDYVRPDRVHVLSRGVITRSGGPELAHELEREGYVEIVG